MSVDHKLMTQVAVPVLTGSIAYVSTKTIFKGLENYPSNVEWGNKTYDSAIVSGGANMVGNAVAELAHEFIFPLIPHSDKWSEPVTLGVSTLLQTAVNVGVHQYLNSGNLEQVGLVKLASVSAFSYLLASSTWEKAILPVLSI